MERAARTLAAARAGRVGVVDEVRVAGAGSARDGGEFSAGRAIVRRTQSGRAERTLRAALPGAVGAPDGYVGKTLIRSDRARRSRSPFLRARVARSALLRISQRCSLALCGICESARVAGGA